MEKVSAIVIRSHGQPAEVAQCESVDLAAPGPGEVRVRMEYAPINPADLNVLEGKYPVRPELPGIPGVEGVGTIEAVGAEASGFTVGTPVLLPHRFGTWREAGNVPAAEVVPVPPGIPLEQAAMVRVNPATALLMLREFTELRAGEWVVQNAANSAVGRCVIALARHYGWRTLNVVRRPELVEELRALGGDAVLLDSDAAKAEGRRATDGAPIRLALNAVGGESAVRIAGLLRPGGTVVTYGAMGRQPLRIPNGLLIFQDLAWRGFWVTRWYEHASAEQRAALFAGLFQLLQTGVLHTPVEATYPLSQIATALEHAARPMRGGKILLRCS